MALLLATAALSLLPAAEAHQCSGNNCGPCPEDGQTHNHADSRGIACTSGYGGSAEANGPEGRASANVPGSGVFWTLAALAVAGALVVRRR